MKRTHWAAQRRPPSPPRKRPRAGHAGERTCKTTEGAPILPLSVGSVKQDGPHAEFRAWLNAWRGQLVAALQQGRRIA